MTTAVATGAPPSPGSVLSRSGITPAGWLACLAALAAAAALRGLIATNEDVSWLIHVAQRVVGGARLYVDFFEVNPPASVLIYVPAVLLAKVSGSSPEQATDALVFLGCAASLLACRSILEPAGLLPDRTGPLLFGAVLILLALPTYTFAEREHAVTLAVLPALAALAVRCRGRRIGGPSLLMAGVGAGIAVSIKPIFALGLLGPAACVIVRAGWLPLAGSCELWLGALLAGAYGLAVAVLLPAFTGRVLPVALAVYVPNRLPFVLMLACNGMLFWLAAMMGVALGATRQPQNAAVPVLATSSAGFALAFLLQGKGFAYQCYPAVALGFLAVLVGAAGRAAAPGHPSGRRLVEAWAQAAFLIVAGTSGAFLFDHHYDPDVWAPGLREAVRTVAPDPTMLAVTDNLALGQPFARAAGGRWVGSAPSTWITGNAQALVRAGADPARFQSFIEGEQAMYADDIETRRPDVILVGDSRWQAWIDGSPRLSRAMGDYVRRGRYGDVAAWVRRPEASP